MATQRTWSKYKSSLEGPNKTRMDLYKNLPSVSRTVYGKIKAIRGEESYNDSFKTGIQVQIDFDIGEIARTHSDTWFILDLTNDQFVSTYGSVTSVQAQIANGIILHVALTYKQPYITKSFAKIISDLNHKYDKDDSFDAYSLGSIINGIGDQPLYIKKVIKPVGISRFKTAIEVSDGGIKLAASGKNFVEINSSGITIGTDSLNFQCLPSSIKFAGIISMQSPFLGLIPSTPVTPIPQYMINLPIETIETLTELATIMGSIIGT